MWEWWKKLNNYDKISIVALGIAILLRFIVAGMTVPTGDSIWHANAARFIAENKAIPLFESIGRLDAFWAPPLVHFFGAFMYLLGSPFGLGNLFLKFVIPIFSAGALITFFFFARDLLGSRKGLFAVLFFSFLPMSFYYSTLFHIDMAIAFFAIATTYAAYKNKFYLTAILFGLGMLTKYNLAFVLPVVLYLLLRKCTLKQGIKRFVLFGIISGLIGMPWYIRNIIYLGNPIYHFLSPVFEMIGLEPFTPVVHTSRTMHSILEIFTPIWYLRAYLDSFGVPLGRIANLLLLKNFPFYPWTLFAWIVSTIIFIFPMFVGFFKKKSVLIRNIVIWWTIPHFIQLIIFVMNYGAEITYFRYFLPAFPAIAFIWAIGVDKIGEKINFKKLFLIFILISCLFVASEIAKAQYSSKPYTRYSGDFDWIKENIEGDALILPQSLTFSLHRFSLPVDGSFAGQELYYIQTKIPDKFNHFNEDELKSFDEVYANNKTKIKVFKLKEDVSVELYKRRERSV